MRPDVWVCRRSQDSARGLQAAKEGGAFGGMEPFLVVWISDSGHEIMAESVRRLNSKAVAKEFLREFG